MTERCMWLSGSGTPLINVVRKAAEKYISMEHVTFVTNRVSHKEVDDSPYLSIPDIFSPSKVLCQVDLRNIGRYDIQCWKQFKGKTNLDEVVKLVKGTCTRHLDSMVKFINGNCGLMIVETPIGAARWAGALMCRASGIPVVAVNPSPFREMVRVDNDSFYQGGYLNSYDNWLRIMSAVYREDEDAYFESWLHKTTTSMSTRGSESHVRGTVIKKNEVTKEDWICDDIGEELVLPEEFILVIGQMPDDANQLMFQRGLGYDPKWAVGKLREITDMPIIFKMHPQDPRDGDGAWVAKQGVKLVGGGINIHHLISRAERVVTWNSNAGMESLMYNKPVMMLGEAYWRNKDITFDVDGINSNIAGFMEFEPDHCRIRQLLQFLVCRFLIPSGDGEAMARRIMNLKNGTPFYGV